MRREAKDLTGLGRGEGGGGLQVSKIQRNMEGGKTRGLISPCHSRIKAPVDTTAAIVLFKQTSSCLDATPICLFLCVFLHKWDGYCSPAGGAAADSITWVALEIT